MANQTQAPVASLDGLDRRPKGVTPQEVQAFAELSPEERIAAYVNSIRKMMVFFVVVTVIGLVAAVVLALVDINALNSIHQSQLPTNPFG